MTPGRAFRLAWPAFLAPFLWLLASPGGDFPLNDDWAYASAVGRLVEGGRLRLSDWATPFDLPPILSAALPAALFGFSHVLLRVVTLFWGVAGLWTFERWLREEGVSSSGRLLNAAALLFCPLWFVLLFSFHTEIPFLTLCLGALYAFRRADRENAAGWEIAGGLLAALAFLTRQTGLALLAGQTLWTAMDRRLTPARLGRTALPTLLLGGGFLLWFWAVHGPTWAFAVYLWGGTGKHLLSGGAATAAASRAIGALLTAALFCIPLTPIPRGKNPVLTALLIGTPLALFARWNGGLPFFENVWHPKGLGPLTGIASEAKSVLPSWGSPLLWAMMTAAAVAAAAFHLSAFTARTASRPARHAICLWAPLALATLPGAKFFDRYVLMWLPLFLLPAALGGTRGVKPFRWLALAFWGVVSVTGTRDYFAWNRAKWSLGEKALAMGYKPEEIANGVDWAGWFYYDRRMAGLRAMKPLNDISEMEWKEGPLPKVFITFRPDFAAPPFLLSTARYSSPIASRTAALFLYRTKW